jgi:hypothetical protein
VTNPEQDTPVATPPPTGATPTAKQLAQMRGAVAVATGGSMCVICQNDDGKFVTTERHCLDVGGTVIEKFYGPCPVPTGNIALATSAENFVRCSVSGTEFYTTAENCKAWNGKVVETDPTS